MSSTRPLLLLLCGVFWAMAVSVSPRVGATADERVHLVGGYSYWKFDDYRLQPENGNLTMRVEALPLLAMRLKFPPLDSEGFQQARANDVGHDFLFGSGNPFGTMLTRSRAMVALFGVVILWLVWSWARHLFGTAAGWLAATVAAFCPTLLAHSGLATSDAALTACLLAAISACWRLLHRLTWWRLLVAAVTVAAALLAKFSAVLLAPLALALLVLRWVHPAPLPLGPGRRLQWLRRRGQVIVATGGAALATAAIALVLLWGAYGFRYAARNPRLAVGDGSTQLEWGRLPLERTIAAGDPTTRVLQWTRERHLLPEAYLYGFADSYVGSRRRPAFLMGEISSEGWTQFFPIAFALKTPPTVLLLLAAGVSAIGRASLRGRRDPSAVRWPRRAWLYRAAPLLLLFVLYGGIALNTPLNIGHRHLLPIYPVVYVAVGAAAGWLMLARRRWLATVFVVGIGAAHAADSWTSRPFYLSYFTPWIGGAARGWHYLVDSSIDWGQGLPDLAAWQAAKDARGDATPVFLTYFGTDSPEARGLRVTRFGDLVTDLTPRAFPAQVRGGWFVISVTHFQRVYLDLGGAWTAARERRYAATLRQLAAAPPDLAARAEAERQEWGHLARDYEQLQFARLCHYLGRRAPDALLAYSLLVFRLSDAEVQQALYGPLPP